MLSCNKTLPGIIDNLYDSFDGMLIINNISLVMSWLIGWNRCTCVFLNDVSFVRCKGRPSTYLT